jgi:hypothetical protein
VSPFHEGKSVGVRGGKWERRDGHPGEGRRRGGDLTRGGGPTLVGKVGKGCEEGVTKLMSREGESCG